MPTIAYLANRFPAAVEPYVGEEIEELRRRGVRVIAGSIRRPDASQNNLSDATAEYEKLCLKPLGLMTLLRALDLAAGRWHRISPLVARALFRGRETPQRRLKALLHTWLGACYAILLQGRSVDHIHVHHGYFGSWVGMVAARLLGASFSMTLHGSDLLVHDAYLDAKLSNCLFCVTISEYNRRYILQRFPQIDPRVVMVSRLGVDVCLKRPTEEKRDEPQQRKIKLLAAGRLHAVKNHAFLVRACGRLRDLGLDFECEIAGDGVERRRLECLIRKLRLQDRVRLLGHIARDEMSSIYRSASLFVLTSLSEGIPVVLMEAMASGTIVLAPAITGIPELVVPGKSGFLYKAGDLEDFVQRILSLEVMLSSNRDASAEVLNRIRRAARQVLLEDFDHQKNLCHFADRFLQLLAPSDRSTPHEDPILQQV